MSFWQKIEGEDSARSLCARAMCGALDAGGFEGGEIDLTLVVGDAADLLLELGLRAPATNFESTCSSALIGLSFARDLIRARSYTPIRVETCCTYTREADPSDSFPRGRGRFVGESSAGLDRGYGLRREYALVSGGHALDDEDRGSITERPREARAYGCAENTEIAGRSNRDHSETYLRPCTQAMSGKAGTIHRLPGTQSFAGVY